MISLRFVKRVATLPLVILRTIVLYYTSGTVYLTTNKEFTHSLFKNVHLAVEHHLANNFSCGDVARFVYTPVSSLFTKYANHPFVQGLHGYGEKINSNTFWLVRPDKHTDGAAKSAVLFLHGGGFCLPIFAAQFLGILALYHAVPQPKRALLLVAILDYLLTCHSKKYPTQIFEAAAAYRELINSGYTRITLVGDSAGSNLALALARFVAYPHEAKEQFAPYTDFDWDFSPFVPPNSDISALIQPANFVLISPWIEPYTNPTLMGNNVEGDLGAIDTQMGDWYVEGLDREQLSKFVNFVSTEYSQWKDVEAINGTGRTLYIYGEREILRFGVEKFAAMIENGGGKVERHIEEGGIHDGLFYVESLDYMGLLGVGAARRALENGFGGKYAITMVGEFLGESA